MRQQNNIIQGILLILIIIIQGMTLKGKFEYYPNIFLAAFLFTAHNTGPMKGQIIGFTCGLVLDFLSNSPLGFHAFIYTVLGAIFGNLRGKFYFDSFIAPVLSCIAAAMIMEVNILLLKVLLGILKGYHPFNLEFFIQAGITALAGPVIYLVLRLTKVIIPSERDSLL